MDPQLLSIKKKMQVEIILKESDLKKNERSKLTVETELRDLKHKVTLLQTEIASRENSLKNIESEHMTLQNEIIKLKHKMFSLGQNH